MSFPFDCTFLKWVYIAISDIWIGPITAEFIGQTTNKDFVRYIAFSPACPLNLLANVLAGNCRKSIFFSKKFFGDNISGTSFGAFDVPRDPAESLSQLYTKRECNFHLQ